MSPAANPHGGSRAEATAPDQPLPDPCGALLALCNFAPAGTAVTCAVSGGADSMALAALAVAAGLRVTVVHVDHGLRTGSSAEAAIVRANAELLGTAFRAEQVHLTDGPNLEARAREARYAVLPAGVLTGHTADDQAETVLLRLLRGTGPTGLAAMRPDQHPLLALRRAETEQLCAHLGVAPFEDPSNDDDRFVRNRVRHEVVPLLDDVAGRDVVPLLCRLAALAAEDADLVAALAAGLDPCDARALAAAPRPVASAAWRAWWCAGTGSSHPPDRAATDRVLDVAAGRATSCDVVDGWRVHRTAGRLRLERSTGG
jgi:tRNA(Ile)-lysidine synthase